MRYGPYGGCISHWAAKGGGGGPNLAQTSWLSLCVRISYKGSHSSDHVSAHAGAHASVHEVVWSYVSGELKKAVAVSEEKIQQRSQRRGRFSSSHFLAGKCPNLRRGNHFPAASKFAGKLFQQ